MNDLSVQTFPHDAELDAWNMAIAPFKGRSRSHRARLARGGPPPVFAQLARLARLALALGPLVCQGVPILYLVIFELCWARPSIHDSLQMLL